MDHLELFRFHTQVLEVEQLDKESSFEDAENLSFLTDLNGMTISEYHLVLWMIKISDGLARTKYPRPQIFVHLSYGVWFLLYQVHNWVVDLQVI